MDGSVLDFFPRCDESRPDEESRLFVFAQLDADGRSFLSSFLLPYRPVAPSQEESVQILPLLFHDTMLVVNQPRHRASQTTSQVLCPFLSKAEVYTSCRLPFLEYLRPCNQWICITHIDVFRNRRSTHELSRVIRSTQALYLYISPEDFRALKVKVALKSFLVTSY